MHSHITTPLFLLASLSTALCSLVSTAPPSQSTHAAPVCLERYTTYYNSAYNYVFFTHPDEPHFNLTIVTAYLEFYPHTLAAWLAERGFAVLQSANLTDDELCGWTYGAFVDVRGRRHGRVGWKHNAASDDRFPSPEPRAATVDVVESVLRDNTPWADIYYLRTMLLDMACSILGVALACCAVVGCVETRRTNKLLQTVREDNAGSELDLIRTRGLAGAGMQSMSNDGPAVRIEIVEPTKAESASTTSCVADPPPMYTLSGGRLPVRVREVV